MKDIAHPIALALLRAKETKTPIRPWAESGQEFGIETAYAIQRALEKQESSKIVGFKMGLTSVKKRQQMNLRDPIVGYLSARNQLLSGGKLDLDSLIHPRIECEIILKLKSRIPENLERSIAPTFALEMAAAIEIIDSRYVGFKYFSLPDVIADNASAASYIVGRWSKTRSDLSKLKMELFCNGKLIQQSHSDEISGDPWNSLVSFSQLQKTAGVQSNAGDVLLLGAAGEALPVERNSEYTLSVDGLETVSFST